MKTIAFFSVNRGVGQTSLVYHLAWMYQDLGSCVLAVDLDPQAALSSMFLEDAELRDLWGDGSGRERTVHGALAPLLEGSPEPGSPHLEELAPSLYLLAGSLALCQAEASLSREWIEARERNPETLPKLAGVRRLVERAAAEADARIVLIDLGPNLGAINRAALFAADEVVLVLGPDIRSFHGLQHFGSAVRSWNEASQANRERPAGAVHQGLPMIGIRPAGYTVLMPLMRLDRPLYVPVHWLRSFPATFEREVLGQSPAREPDSDEDPHLIASLRNHAALEPLAQEARKPLFRLKPADGATGSFMSDVTNCYRQYRDVAERIARSCRVDLSLEGH